MNGNRESLLDRIQAAIHAVFSRHAPSFLHTTAQESQDAQDAPEAIAAPASPGPTEDPPTDRTRTPSCPVLPDAQDASETTVASASPAAPGATESPATGQKGIAPDSIIRIVLTKRLCAGIKAGQSLGGAEPQMAFVSGRRGVVR